MEWYIMNSTGVRSLATELVLKLSDAQYSIQDDCADVLEELLEKIESDDPNTNVTKRHLLAERIVVKDLIPLIKFASPDPNELSLVLRLLATLCEPLEEGSRPQMATSIQQDLYALTRQVRKAFFDVDFVERLLHHVKELVEEAGQYEMAREGYDSIKHLLMLVRNVLHCIQKEQIIKQTALKGLLLKNGIGGIIIYSITCHNRDELALSVAQLLSQLYHTFQWTVAVVEGDVEAEADHYVNDKLKCLVVQLLQGSLSTLTVALQKHELKTNEMSSYMPWCLAYFLPLVEHVAIPVSKIRGILSTKCVGYLVYQLSMLSINLYSFNGTTSSRDVDWMMLIFSALDSLLSTAMSCKPSSLDKEELKIVTQFYRDLVEMTDLWRILLFYITNFDHSRFPRSFLAQLVCINHKLFTAVELYNQLFCGQLEQTVLEHIKQFATPKVVQQYTLLVETYSTNTEQTNMAVFTMLGHICVDCDSIHLLYTPSLLRLFSALSANAQVSEDDRRLADFVSQSFHLSSHQLQEEVKDAQENIVSSSGEGEVATGIEWSESEENELFSAYADLAGCADEDNMVELITEKLSLLGISHSKEHVVQKLQELGIVESSSPDEQDQSDISEIIQNMVDEGHNHFISWIHQALVTASFVKALPKNTNSRHSPICRYSSLRGHSCPLIPYSEKLSHVFGTHAKSAQLLSMLGIMCQPFNGSYLAMIPADMTAAQLYTAAERLKSVETTVVEGELDLSVSSSEQSKSEEEVFVAKSASGQVPDAHMAMGNAVTGNVWLSYMNTSTSH